jgi:phosphoribosyl 1,2-cyclic phosphodiesterase
MSWVASFSPLPKVARGKSFGDEETRMPMHFTVLASGSAGNASLVEADGFGILIDLGLGPRQLAARLATVGANWHRVHAVILSHTHCDHWNERTLIQLRRLDIPLYCHPLHHAVLHQTSQAFAQLKAKDLVREYEPNHEVELSPNLRCRPFPLPHDGGLTCGFRFEGPANLFGEPAALGYAADLGSWHNDLAATLANVDLLALEFNHDVAMERASGRSPRLIARVLGDVGHLSNVQAAALMQAAIKMSTSGRLQQLVQLHLSRDCNRQSIASAVAKGAIRDLGLEIEVHTARQDSPSPTFSVARANRSTSRGRVAGRNKLPRDAARARPWLPGMEVQ